MAAADWLIIELSEQSDGCTYSEIVTNIHNLFGEDVEFFIPTYQEKMGSYTSSCTLFDGYVFIKDTEDIRSSLLDLHDYRMFSKVLESHGHAHTINSNDIGIMKRKLKKSIKRKISIGSKVKILEGIFSNLPGEVVGIDDGGKKIMVRIKTLSREMIAPLPSTSVVEELVI